MPSPDRTMLLERTGRTAVWPRQWARAAARLLASPWGWMGAFVLVAGAAAALLGIAARPSPGHLPMAQGASPPELAERWGVDRLRVLRSGAGHLLDFRYRIVDPEKAARFQVRSHKPVVVHEKTGARLAVPSTPKAGRLWNSGRPEAGRTYFALFSNLGHLVKRGDRVSVVIGDFIAANLVVE